MAAATTWQLGGVCRWRRQFVPVTVWILAAGAAAAMFARRSSSCDLLGVAVPEQRAIAALTDGRVRLLPVGLFESVKAGQTLAVLEDERIQTALATAQAEAARLRAAVVAEEIRLATEAATQESDYLSAARRYAVDVESNRLREVELQVTIEADRVRLEYLRVQRDLFGSLREQEAIPELRFKSAEAEFVALAKTMAENENALSVTRQDLAEARRRQEEFTALHKPPAEFDKVLEPLRAAITVQERLMDELSTKQAMLVLTCPLDGKVSQLLHGVGESVCPGDPILTIVSARPTAVVVYAAPPQLARLEEGAPVRLELSRDGWGRQTAVSRVQAVGPAVDQLPARLWRNPTVPEWGWPVRIVMPAGLDALCGETIGVAAQGSAPRPGTWGAAPVNQQP